MIEFASQHAGAEWMLRLADEYLPELYDVAHHDAKRDGLEEFAELFDALPIQWSAALPKIDSVTLDLINREISNLHALMSSSRLDHPVVSADDFAWLRHFPRRLWKPLAEILCTLGKRELGNAIWSIWNACAAERNRKPS